MHHRRVVGIGALRAVAPVTAAAAAAVTAAPCSTSGRQPQPAPAAATVARLSGAAAVAAVALLSAGPALAMQIHAEPANALSLPTWAVHTSSVLEWVTAIVLMWRLAEATGNERWKGMAWGMVPSLGGAMCACTWHFFYNAPELDVSRRLLEAPLPAPLMQRPDAPSSVPPLQFLVALQAFLTVVGNFTCWAAAYRLYTAAQAEKA
jgi:hypothetical protein